MKLDININSNLISQNNICELLKLYYMNYTFTFKLCNDIIKIPCVYFISDEIKIQNIYYDNQSIFNKIYTYYYNACDREDMSKYILSLFVDKIQYMIDNDNFIIDYDHSIDNVKTKIMQYIIINGEIEYGLLIKFYCNKKKINNIM